MYVCVYVYMYICMYNYVERSWVFLLLSMTTQNAENYMRGHISILDIVRIVYWGQFLKSIQNTVYI
jgi:hypothetical protein